jgi:hypothetical protein
VHVVPHSPQFVLSVCRSEHVPAQLTVPVGHEHTPAMHARLLPQMSEQSPQFCLSVCRSTQVAAAPVPHCEKPDAVHRMAHVPSLHTGFAPVQAVPHAPQSTRLDCRFWQLPAPIRPPAHCVSPVGQAHVPFVHAPPPAHTVPHAPQSRLSVSRLTQALPH